MVTVSNDDFCKVIRLLAVLSEHNDGTSLRRDEAKRQARLLLKKWKQKRDSQRVSVKGVR